MNEILLNATRFSVERRQYNVANRGTVQRELVVHPGAATILPLLSPDTVVMIHNYRFSVGSELLELPAGTLEPPEPPIDCAARELIEETGYQARHIEPLADFYTSPGFTNEHMFAFVASDLKHVGQKLDATEQIRVKLLSLSDALAATCDGRIIDGKTIAILHLYHYCMEKNG